MFMEAEIIKKDLHDFIIENTIGDKSKLSADSLIFVDGYFDSMGFVSLISFLESKYAINTSDEDLVEENFESINAIVNFIGRKKQN